MSEKEQNEKKNNHFTVTIRTSNKEVYEKARKLSNDLGCSMGDIVWYSIAKMFESKSEPKSFGLR